LESDFRIVEAPVKPDRTPFAEITIKAEKSDGFARCDRSPYFTQQIEQKLWKYSTSGNVAKRGLLEIISWTLSAVCMGAIIGVLLHLQNRRTPTWPLGITLKAYIIVLPKVASAALLLPVSEAIG
jgi:hypothetical protein